MKLLDHAIALDELITQGKWLTAIQRYFHTGFKMQAEGSEQTVGKAAKMQQTKAFFEQKGKLLKAECHHTFLVGKSTYSEFSFTFQNAKGEQEILHEIIQRDWDRFQVVKEHFFEFRNATGQAPMVWNQLYREKFLDQPIPDKDSEGITSYILFEQPGEIQAFILGLDVEHPYPSDLQITLTSPSGETFFLHTRDWKDTNLQKLFTAKDLPDLIGQPLQGLWELKLVDHAAKHEGQANWWCLEIQYDHTDELTRIEGIGPKIQEALQAAGLKNFRQLALSSPEEIRSQLTASGSKFNLQGVETWPFQAALAVGKEWAKLEEIQGLLQNGRWRED
jgi:subtilisin-like proprotein convertase family protein